MVAYGTRNGRAVLNPRKVAAIRSAVKRGASKTELARKYAVSVRTIYNIVAKTTWAR